MFPRIQAGLLGLVRTQWDRRWLELTGTTLRYFDIDREQVRAPVVFFIMRSEFSTLHRREPVVLSSPIAHPQKQKLAETGQEQNRKYKTETVPGGQNATQGLGE